MGTMNSERTRQAKCFLHEFEVPQTHLRVMIFIFVRTVRLSGLFTICFPLKVKEDSAGLLGSYFKCRQSCLCALWSHAGVRGAAWRLGKFDTPGLATHLRMNDDIITAIVHIQP